LMSLVIAVLCLMMQTCLASSPIRYKPCTGVSSACGESGFAMQCCTEASCWSCPRHHQRDIVLLISTPYSDMLDYSRTTVVIMTARHSHRLANLCNHGHASSHRHVQQAPSESVQMQPVACLLLEKLLRGTSPSRSTSASCVRGAQALLRLGLCIAFHTLRCCQRLPCNCVGAHDLSICIGAYDRTPA